MKYHPKLYADAFIRALKDASPADEPKLVGNFLELVRRNNDEAELKKIFAEIDSLFRKAHGIRKVTIESARALANAKETFGRFLKKNDVVEEVVNPELVAGVKITVDDEMQFDASLKRKLDIIFKN